MTMNYPPLAFVMTLAFLALSTWVGDALRKRVGIARDDPRNEAAGMLLGRRLGEGWGPRIEVAGGILLIAIGIKIVVDHMP